MAESIFDLFTIVVYSLFSESISEQTHGAGWTKNDLGDELFTLIVIISGLVNAFCKEKIEDELISKIRLESLVVSLLMSGVCHTNIFDSFLLLNFQLQPP